MIKISKVFKNGKLEEKESGYSDVLEHYEQVLEAMQENGCSTMNVKFEHGSVLFMVKE